MKAVELDRTTLAEYRSLRETAGLYLDPERAVLRVEGAGGLKALDGLASNDLASLAEGRALRTFILTPRGRPLADPSVLNLEGDPWLDLRIACLDGLVPHIRTYLPPRLARLSPMPGVRRASVLGPHWAGVAERMGLEPLRDDQGGPVPLQVLRLPGDAGEGARTVVRDPADGSGLDVYVPANGELIIERLRGAVGAVGGGEVGHEAFEVWRIELGIPVYGKEITEANLPQETGLVERAVSFDKGCYTGQEVVARIHYRGHVNRHLRGLLLDSALPTQGQVLYAGDREVGSITSSARSPRLGAIALAYVRRETAPGMRVSFEPEAETVGTVADLPFTFE